VFEVLAPGHGVWIEREGRGVLACRLHRVVDDEGWWLVAHGAPPALGETVHLSWGTHTGAWVAPSRVLQVLSPGPSADGSFHLHTEMLVEPPNVYSRCERRRYLRVRCVVPFGLQADGREVRGTCRDLSASGMRGVLEVPVREHLDVNVALALPLGTVDVPGRIVRLARRRARTDVALSFYPDEHSEDRIVAFVVDRERAIFRRRPNEA
jgi:hypothetical protein